MASERRSAALSRLASRLPRRAAGVAVLWAVVLSCCTTASLGFAQGASRTASTAAAPPTAPKAPATPPLGAAPLGRVSPRRRVALLPLGVVAGRPADLFAPERPVPHTALVSALQQRLARDLAGYDDLELLTPEAVRDHLAADRSGQTASQIAAERYRLGLEYYHGLAPTRAADSLRTATRLYFEIFQDLIAAKPYADALFMLGVALVDAGDAVGAHLAFKDAFAMASTRRFRPRFFAPQVEAAMSAALVDYLSSGAHARPYGEATRLQAIARRLDVDALLVVALIDRGDAPPELAVTAFRARTGLVEAEARFAADRVDALLEPFLSRWLACLPPRATAAPPRLTPPASIRVDTSAAYALYLAQPTRKSFHSLGFVAGASGALRQGFDWHARVTMDTSLSDPNRDLIRAFNSVRLVAGVGFTLERGRWHVALHPGVDARLLGSFVATTDPDCKLFGEDHRLCDRSSISDLGSDLLVGPNIAVVLGFELGRRFILRAAGSISAYILPFGSVDALNYPASFEVGLGYRL